MDGPIFFDTCTIACDRKAAPRPGRTARRAGGRASLTRGTTAGPRADARLPKA